MKSISNFYKTVIIIVLTLIISYNFPSMFSKGGMDVNFHYLNFLFALIVVMILIYDFYEISFFKKLIFVFTISLLAFVLGISIVEVIIKKVYGSDYELYIGFNNLKFCTNILFYSIIISLELLSFQIIKRFYKKTASI